jgi:hypothetical protein
VRRNGSSRHSATAQRGRSSQQKRGLEIAIAEPRQIHSSFYNKLLDQADGSSRGADEPAIFAPHCKRSRLRSSGGAQIAKSPSPGDCRAGPGDISRGIDANRLTYTF